jgi:tetratricopeptide (TPR) repeat protein
LLSGRLDDLHVTCLRATLRLLAFGFGLIATQSCAWSQPISDASDCVASPQHTCVLDLAFTSALTIATPLKRDAALQAVVAARKSSGLPAAPGGSRAAAASALVQDRASLGSRASIPANQRIEALSWIAITQLELGLTEDAEATLAGSPRIDPPSAGYDAANALRVLATAQARAGQKAQAEISFEQAMQSIDAEPDQWLRASQTLLIAEAWSTVSPDKRNAAFAQALRAAQGMPDDRLKAKALGAIAEAQLRTGLAEDARRAFEQALAFEQSIARIATRSEALLELSGKLAGAGMKSQAVDALDGTLQAALAGPTEQPRLEMLLQIAKAYAQHGQPAKAAAAFSAALAIPEAAGRTFAILSVARAQAAVGLASDATATLRQAQTSPALADDPMRPENRKDAPSRTQETYDRYGASMLGTIAQAQARAGLRTEAAQSFREALRTARGIASSRTRAMTLATIAAAAPAAGLPAGAIADEADASLSDAQRNLRLRDLNRDQALSEFGLALVTSARGLGMSGARVEGRVLFEKALDAAKDITDPWARYSMLRMIAEELAASGDINQAMQVVQEMKTPERVDALLAVAAALPAPARDKVNIRGLTIGMPLDEARRLMQTGAWQCNKAFGPSTSDVLWRCDDAGDGSGILVLIAPTLKVVSSIVSYLASKGTQADYAAELSKQFDIVLTWDAARPGYRATLQDGSQLWFVLEGETWQLALSNRSLMALDERARGQKELKDAIAPRP